MIVLLKFASGFLSNALTQTARCLWNLIACTARLVFSLLYAILAALQTAAGGSKQSKKTLRLMLSALSLSLKCGLLCFLQGLGVLTCASPLMRAAQACSEDIRPKGILLPCGYNRSLAQRILGLNSWEDQKAPNTRPEIKLVPAPTTAADKTQAPTEQKNGEEAKIKPPTKQMKSVVPVKTKATKKNAEWASWESLAKQYLDARTIEEMNRIRNKMALEHTRKYINALQTASSSKSNKKAA